MGWQLHIVFWTGAYKVISAKTKACKRSRIELFSRMTFWFIDRQPDTESRVFNALKSLKPCIILPSSKCGLVRSTLQGGTQMRQTEALASAFFHSVVQFPFWRGKVRQNPLNTSVSVLIFLWTDCLVSFGNTMWKLENCLRSIISQNGVPAKNAYKVKIKEAWTELGNKIQKWAQSRYFEKISCWRKLTTRSSLV